MNEVRTRALRRDERDLARETLAASFDNDPLFQWMLPDARDRAAWLRWFHGVSLDDTLSMNTATTLEEGAAAGVITVFPPGARGPSIAAWIAALRRPPGRWPTWRLASVGLRVEARIEALRPATPVVYVHVLGAHPARKGQGVGGALLRSALDLAKRERVPLYLETSNPINLGFYKRFGLTVRAEIRVADAPPLWTLMTGSP